MFPAFKMIQYIFMVAQLSHAVSRRFYTNPNSNPFGDFALGSGYDMTRYEPTGNHIFLEGTEGITYDLMPTTNSQTRCDLVTSAKELTDKLNVRGEVSVTYNFISGSGFVDFDQKEEQMRRKSYYICTIDRTLFTVSINAPVISDDMTPTERERYLPVDFAHQTDRDILRERIGDYHVQSITYGRRYQTEVELTYTNENAYQKISGEIQANIGVGALSVSAKVAVDLESESREEDFSMVLASEAFGFLEEEPLFLPSTTDSEGRTVEQQVEDMITRNLNAFNQVDLNSNLQAQTGLNKITLFQELGDAYPLSYTVAPNNRYYSPLIPLTPLEEQRLVKHVDVAYNIKRELQDLEITIEQRAERLFQNYQLLSGATELSMVFLQVRQQITDEILELHAEVDEYLEQTPHQLAEKDVYRWAFDSSDKTLQHTSLDVFATEVYQLMGMDDAPMEEDANPVGATCLFNGIQATLDRGLESERQQKFAGRVIFGDMTVRHVLFDMNGKVVSLGFIDHTYEEYRPEYIDCPDEVGETCHELVFVREDCTLLKTGDKVWFAEGRYVIDKIGSDEHIAQGHVVKEKLTNIRIKLKSEDVDRDTIVVLTDEHIGDVTLRGFQNSYDLTQDLARRLMFSYGYVCDSGGFSATEAKMVCTHLGYANLRDFQTGQEIPSSNAWGRPFVTLWDLQCSEFAMDLSECDYKTGELSDGDWEKCGSRNGIFIFCSDEHLEEDDVKITITTMSTEGCVLQNWEGKREPEEICRGESSDQLDAVANVRIEGDVCLMMYQGGDVRCVIRGENGENYDMTQAIVRDRWCYESFDSESFPAELELVSQYPNGKGCLDTETSLVNLEYIEVNTCAEGKALGLCQDNYTPEASPANDNGVSEEDFRSDLQDFRDICIKTCDICPEVVTPQYYMINIMNEESEDHIPTKVTLLVDDMVIYSHNFRGAEIIAFGNAICGSKIQLMFEPEEPYTPEQVTCRTQDVRGTRMENNIGFVYGEVDISFSCTGTLDYQVHETAGDLSCRSGYEEITTEAECQSAAAALGYEFSGDLLINNPNRMPYCWIGQGTRVNFNHNADTGSNFADTPARILCQLSRGPLVDIGSDGCTANSPCGQCEGDCDNDADCGAGLRCFLRDTSFELIPGCSAGGSGDIPTHDYCYAPESCYTEEKEVKCQYTADAFIGDGGERFDVAGVEHCKRVCWEALECNAFSYVYSGVHSGGINEIGSGACYYRSGIANANEANEQRSCFRVDRQC